MLSHSLSLRQKERINVSTMPVRACSQPADAIHPSSLHTGLLVFSWLCSPCRKNLRAARCPSPPCFPSSRSPHWMEPPRPSRCRRTTWLQRSPPPHVLLGVSTGCDHSLWSVALQVVSVACLKFRLSQPELYSLFIPSQHAMEAGGTAAHSRAFNCTCARTHSRALADTHTHTCTHPRPFS